MPDLVRSPHDEAPTSGVPALTAEDVGDINRRLLALRERMGGRRMKPAFFRCPWPCTRRQYEQVRDRAVNKWIDDMEKQGWILKSRVYVNAERHRPSTRYSGDWVIPGSPEEVEIPVVALFQVKKEEPVRIEMQVKEPGAAEETARLDLVKGGSN